LRVDKFIWAVRLFKTRTSATQMVKDNKVQVGGETVKPSRNLKIGELITFTKNGLTLTVEVLDFPKSRIGAKFVDEHIKDRTPQEDQERNELLIIARNLDRRKGLGRPTKRERRDLENFFSDEDE